MPPTAKLTTKIIRIMIYLPQRKTVPDDLQYVGHRRYQVGPTSSCSGSSHHTLASDFSPLITGSRVLVVRERPRKPKAFPVMGNNFGWINARPADAERLGEVIRPLPHRVSIRVRAGLGCSPRAGPGPILPSAREGRGNRFVPIIYPTSDRDRRLNLAQGTHDRPMRDAVRLRQGFEGLAGGAASQDFRPLIGREARPTTEFDASLDGPPPRTPQGHRAPSAKAARVLSWCRPMHRPTTGR
jgi:hypothetical protein